MRKRERIALFGIALIILIGIASADFIPNFGKVIGSVNVNNPVFYLDGSQILFSNNSVYRVLLLNEIPDKENISYIYDGNRVVFVSQEIPEGTLFRAKFNIRIWAKTNQTGNLIQFRVIKIKPNLEEEIICVPSPVNITSWYNSFRERKTDCTSPGEIVINEGDMLGLTVMGAGGVSEYWISTGKKYTNGYSRIEVSKAEKENQMDNREEGEDESGEGGATANINERIEIVLPESENQKVEKKQFSLLNSTIGEGGLDED